MPCCFSIAGSARYVHAEDLRRPPDVAARLVERRRGSCAARPRPTRAPAGLGQRARQVDLAPRIARRPRRTSSSEPRFRWCGRIAVVVGQDHRALDAVLQLAHVARPAVGAQRGPARRRRSASPACSSRGRTARRSAARAAGCPPRRSRSGGTVIGNTERRKNRSSRKRRAATAARRLRLVAATTRTSTRTVAVPPTRSNVALLERAQDLGLQRQRQVADLVEEDRAAVAPPRTCPSLRPAAPVNAPFSWPNSSVSSSASGIAAQLIATNGPSLRGLRACTRAREQLLAGPALPFAAAPSRRCPRRAGPRATPA